MIRPKIVESISQALKEVAPDCVSILYGSEARGDARPDSDVDILVIVPDDKDKFADRKIEITERLFDIELNYGIPVSPLVVLKSMWERIHTPFTCNVARDGILI